MHSTKTLVKAAALAILAATGLGVGAASAQPYWDRHDDRARHRYERFDDRFAPHVNRWRIAEQLRFRGLRMAGEPHYVRDRLVVRAHDRFGRSLIVHVNPYSGNIVRVIAL